MNSFSDIKRVHMDSLMYATSGDGRQVIFGQTSSFLDAHSNEVCSRPTFKCVLLSPLHSPPSLSLSNLPTQHTLMSTTNNASTHMENDTAMFCDTSQELLKVHARR